MTCTSLAETRRDGKILQARFPSLLWNLMTASPCFCGISRQHFARRAHIPLSVRSCNSQKPCKNLAGAKRRNARCAKPLARIGGRLSDRGETWQGCDGIAFEGACRTPVRAENNPQPASFSAVFIKWKGGAGKKEMDAPGSTLMTWGSLCCKARASRLSQRRAPQIDEDCRLSGRSPPDSRSEFRVPLRVPWRFSFSNLGHVQKIQKFALLLDSEHILIPSRASYTSRQRGA